MSGIKKGIAAALAVFGLVAIAVLGVSAIASAGPDANAVTASVYRDGVDPAFP